MRFDTKVRIATHKAYFERGSGIISTMKINYVVAAVFLVSMEAGIISVVVYGIGSYVLGRLWFWCGMVEAETEVSNLFNKFVKEMRSNYKKPKDIKKPRQ